MLSDATNNMTYSTTKWTWNDGWLLMSIHMAQSEQGASLSEIIRTADATNHAVPTAEELSSAFTKFVQHGLIEISENTCSICEEYRASIAKAYHAKGGLFKSGEKGLEWLNSSTHPQINTKTVSITKEKVTEAYQEYMGGF